jgi:hypothetical protein
MCTVSLHLVITSFSCIMLFGCCILVSLLEDKTCTSIDLKYMPSLFLCKRNSLVLYGLQIL